MIEAEFRLSQAAGSQKAFDELAVACAADADCPLGTDPARATETFRAIVRSLQDQPVPAADGRELNYQDATNAVIFGLLTEAGVSSGTRRVYGTYWKRIIEHWGTRRLDEPTPSEIHQLARYIKAHVVARRNARGERGAAEHLIAALRCLYRHAENDGHIPAGDNPAPRSTSLDGSRRPAAQSPTPALPRSTRSPRLSATIRRSTPLLLRLHTETVCRRGDELALQRADLDPDQCLIRLREKGESVRWQPVSPTLMTYLQQHAHQRGARAHGQLLRYTDGRPITSRRYDHLGTFGRLPDSDFDDAPDRLAHGDGYCPARQPRLAGAPGGLIESAHRHQTGSYRPL